LCHIPIGFGSWSTLKLASAVDGCDAEFGRSRSNDTGVGVKIPKNLEHWGPGLFGRGTSLVP